jgi:hypothetical protein
MEKLSDAQLNEMIATVERIKYSDVLACLLELKQLRAEKKNSGDNQSAGS